MPEPPGVVIATLKFQAARWDPGQHEILYRAFDDSYTNFSFVGFHFVPAPSRPDSERMAGFPPNSVVYLDCEQRGPTSRARLAYAGAWVDVIRGGPPSFAPSFYCLLERVAARQQEIDLVVVNRQPCRSGGSLCIVL
jgi:hypothetical protein